MDQNWLPVRFSVLQKLTDKKTPNLISQRVWKFRRIYREEVQIFV